LQSQRDAPLWSERSAEAHAPPSASSPFPLCICGPVPPVPGWAICGPFSVEPPCHWPAWLLAMFADFPESGLPPCDAQSFCTQSSLLRSLSAHDIPMSQAPASQCPVHPTPALPWMLLSAFVYSETDAYDTGSPGPPRQGVRTAWGGAPQPLCPSVSAVRL
jgi:hypothetical protein